MAEEEDDFEMRRGNREHFEEVEQQIGERASLVEELLEKMANEYHFVCLEEVERKEEEEEEGEWAMEEDSLPFLVWNSQGFADKDSPETLLPKEKIQEKTKAVGKTKAKKNSLKVAELLEPPNPRRFPISSFSPSCFALRCTLPATRLR